MKIVAVIPARGGSKGIPNKNIRLLNGKPMIYYAIDNALKSKYISDVIVTSDSKEIQLIAKQMGVSFKNRSLQLCNDEVTLDQVVYDTIKENKYDIVITLQPTSPTLHVKTLDNAIKYFIDKNIDTLISVVNNPRLSWKCVSGQIVPNFIERLNRQYLPKEYAETGAFVISKYNVINEKTRIGKIFDVYEISKEEAIDIDDFSELLYAEHILKNNKIFTLLIK